MEAEPRKTDLDAGALSTMDLLIAGMSYMAPGFSLFFTTAVVAGFAGAHMPGVYVLAGLGVLCTGSTLGAFSRAAPGAGSLQLFVEKGFGRRVSIGAGITLLTGYLFLQGAVTVLFGGWSAALIRRHLGLDLPWTVLGVLGVAACGWLMLRGVSLSIKATWVLFLFECVIVLAVAAATLAQGGASGLEAAPLLPIGIESPGSLALAMVYATFSFVGFEGAIAFAEETPDPARAMPVAVVGGIGAIAVLYVVATYAVVIGFGSDHIDAIAKAPEPFSLLAAAYAGPLGGLLEFAVWTSVVANMMAGGNANARILFAMGRSGMLPGSLARIHPEHRTPSTAIVAFMAATLVPMLLSTLAGDYLASFGMLSGFGAILAILVYLLATAGYPMHLRRAGQSLMSEPVGRIIVPLVGVGIWIVPLWGGALPGQGFPYDVFPWAAAAVVVASAWWALGRGSGSTRPI